MRRQALWLAVIALGLVAIAGIAQARGGYAFTDEVLRAIDDYPDKPLPVQKLRAQGPAALDELLALRDQMQEQLAALHGREPSPQSPNTEIAALNRRLARLDELIDQVGMQRYCSRSRLFWHIDLEKAKEAARTSGKPILSLRMLGKLNEDFSCANSRFFRTTLYANDAISKVLREKFVLHWQSVRPVPRVTIDFGDGRKLERTLTGNSVHYILSSDGEVLEALPGLYGPKAFLRKINDGLALAKRAAELTPSERAEALSKYHAQKFAALGEALARDLAKVKASADSLDDSTWQMIAVLHAADAELDNASRELIQSENPTAAAAGRIAITKMVVEDPMLRLVRTLENSIALDTVRNEYQLHRRIHEWLAEATYQPAVDVLNERVYAELFLTPSSDPWLGLLAGDAYTALPNGGVARAGN